MLELPNEMEAIRLLDAAMMHNSFVGDEHSISREVAARGGIRRLCDDFKPTDSSSLTFLSEVICHDGTLRHIPMVDFQRI